MHKRDYQRRVRGDGEGLARLGRWLRRTALVAILVGLAAAGWLLWQSPLMKVNEVEVVGAADLDPAMLAAASELMGQNLFLADIGEAEEKVSRVPLVRSAWVERRWPGKMVVRVEERRPWGYWQVGDQLYVVDDEGYVLDRGQPAEGAPVVVHVDSEHQWLPGEQVDPNAIQLATQLIESAPRSLGLEVVGLEYQDASGLTAVLGGGLRATFGDSHDLEYKVSVLFVLLETAQEEGREMHAVDLRFGDSVSYQ